MRPGVVVWGVVPGRGLFTELVTDAFNILELEGMVELLVLKDVVGVADDMPLVDEEVVLFKSCIVGVVAVVLITAIVVVVVVTAAAAVDDDDDVAHVLCIGVADEPEDDKTLFITYLCNR